MYSQCPECQTRFRVTAAALRAARGTVRCGRCGSAFDALTRLTDTLSDDPPSTPALSGYAAAHEEPRLREEVVLASPPAEPLGDSFHFSADDIEQVFVDARDWQKRFAPSSGTSLTPPGDETPPSTVTTDDDALPSGATGASVVVDEPEAIEDITLEGERIVIEGLPELDDDLRELARVDDEVAPGDDAVRLPEDEAPAVDLDATDEFQALRDVPGAPSVAQGEDEPANSAIAEPAPTPAPEPEPGPAADVAPIAATSPAVEPPAEKIVPLRLRVRPTALDDDTLLDEADDRSRGRGAALAWGTGAFLLAIALVGQFTHHFRGELARDPRIGPTVRAVYASLGRPLAPNWDLGAFDLQQWGANSSRPADAGGAMLVRASLRNGADFAQPMPLLRVELEDRFGGTIARRDFKPREYLKDPAQASRLLEAGARTEAELSIVDAGADAVGYRLDICLPEDGPGVRCAAQSSNGDRGTPQ